MKTILFLFALTASAFAGDRLVTLTWDANPAAESVTSYAVYTSTGAKISTSNTNEATIVIVDNAPTTVYVTALNAYGESDPSASLTITPKPGAPKNIRVTRVVKAP